MHAKVQVAEVQEVVARIIGKPCCRKRVWRGRSLHLGFGERIPHGDPQLIDEFYGEWEIGTYHCAWRVIAQGKVLCGRQDVVDSIDELNQALNEISIGRFASLVQLTPLDVRVEFDNGLAVDFLSTVSDGDACFHIFFGAENLCVQFTADRGWEIGDFDKPWD